MSEEAPVYQNTSTRARQNAQRADIEVAIAELAARYPHDGQNPILYREACELLWNRFREIPAGNRLYQLLRRGTTQTVTKAREEFLESLHDRTRLARADGASALPADLADEVATFANNFFQRALSTAESAFAEQRAAAEASVRDAEARAALAESQRHAIEREVQILAQVRDNLEQRLAAEVARREAESARGDRLEQRAVDIEQRLTVELANLRHHVGALETQLREERARVEALHQHFERQAIAAREALEAKDNAIAQERSTWSTIRETLECAARAAQEDIAQARTELARALTRIDELNDRRAALAHTHETLKTEHGRTQQTLADVQAQYAAVNAAATLLREAKTDLGERLRSALAETERLRQELHAARWPPAPAT